LYDAETMNEIGNYSKTRPKFYWEVSKNAGAFSFPSDSHTEESGVKCICGHE
jgi:hypothetical protein